MRLLLLLAATIPLISGCGPSQSEYNQAVKHAAQLEDEVKSLKAELEDLKFGANRLLTQAKNAIQDKNDGQAKKYLGELMYRHPASSESVEGKVLLAQVDARAAAEEQKRKQEEERKAKEERQALERKQKEERMALERAVRNMKKKSDEMNGITWYRHRNAQILGTYIQAYFGSKNQSSQSYPLRLKLQYYADSWLFVRTVTIKADDKVYELGRQNFERDNSSGKIWEWVDISVPDHQMFSHVMSAKRVVIRFNGDQYYNDFTVPQSQLSQLRDVYQAWKAMGGKGG